MAYERRSFAGAAPTTTLATGISNSDMTLTLTSGTGYPTGANGDFFIVLDPGNVGEEKIRCASRSGTSVTVQTSGRGADSTSASTHAAGVVIEHVWTAVDADEANYAVAQTVGKVTTAGDLLIGSAASTLARLANGTTGLPLVAGASTPAYGQVGTSGIADDAITSAKIAADQITSTEIAADAVGSSEIAADSVTTSELADDAVATANIAALAVTQAKIEAAQQFESGDLKVSARSAATTGWLICDGASYLRATYPDLFTAIGTTYGSADGTHFNVPDFAGRVIVGAGAGSGLTSRARGATGGEETHVLLEAELAAHTHSIDHNHASATTSSDGAHTHLQNTGFVNSGIGAFGTGGGQNDSSTASNGAHTHTLDLPNFTGTSGSDGSGTAHNTMQPFGVANVFIKT